MQTLNRKKKRSFVRRILTIIVSPFGVINNHQSEFLIWFIFTIITGQCGMLANMIVKYYANDKSLSYSIYIDSINGSFYTYSIALVASVLGPIFINFLNSKKLLFKTLKTFTIIAAFFYLFIAGTIYAAIQSKATDKAVEPELNLDYTQLVLYIISIILVSYSYCILKLDDNLNKFKFINDPLFSDEDDKKVEETIVAGKEITQDPNGIEL